jgi:hypothetical protein
MLGWLVEQKQIAPHIPVFDKSQRDDGTFSRSDFIFDAANNRYVCPAGKHLKPAWRSKKNPYRYRASLYDCQSACRPASGAQVGEPPGTQTPRCPTDVSSREFPLLAGGAYAYRNEQCRYELDLAFLFRPGSDRK